MSAPPLERVLPSAERIGLTDDAIRALADMALRIDTDAPLGAALDHLARVVAEAPQPDAMAAVRAANIEAALGRDGARTFYLLLALTQVPACSDRHAARGIDAAITRATLADIGLWVRHLQRQAGFIGLTLELLDWTQYYLRRDLLRINALQFESRPSHAPLRIYRHKEARRLEATTPDGARIDLRTGIPLDEPAGPHDPAEWEIALEPGMPILDMHIPADAHLSVRRLSQSLHEALAYFERLEPGVRPAGVLGEGWLLDPQVRALLPRNAGLHALQRACGLYPSRLPEAKTIRRLFGPDITREDVATLPRDGMNSLQRAVADFLASPENSLKGRGGVILREELSAFAP